MFWDKLSLAFQIALVVLAVVIFSFFDPFGILAPRKKKLQDTPVSVRSIREIGQLITAEYYGEVLSTLQDAEVEEIKMEGNKYLKTMDSLKENYFDALVDYWEHRKEIETGWFRKRKKLEDIFYDNNSDLTNHPFYQKMIEVTLHLADSLNEKVNRHAYDNEKALLKKLFDAKDSLIITRIRKVNQVRKNPMTGKLLGSYFANSIKRLNAEKLNDITADKKFIKRQIIVLGRGWVRAGFDFGSFTEKNFKYDKAKKVVYIYNQEAKILDCDINPWFIPERKIKGFEIIAATNKAKKPDYLNKVKDDCLKKLQQQAEERDITKKAHAFAEESLKNFFSLLLNEDIQRVMILKEAPDGNANLITNDSVRNNRIPFINKTLLTVDSSDREASEKLVLKLIAAKTKGGDSINRFTTSLFQFTSDSVITSPEWKELNELREKKYSRLDSLWFYPHRVKDTIAAWARKEAKKVCYEGSWWITFQFDSTTNAPNFIGYQNERNRRFSEIISSRMKLSREKQWRQCMVALKKKTKMLYYQDTAHVEGKENIYHYIEEGKK